MNNNKTQNPNRAHQYPVITLTVEHVDEDSCTYRNFHDLSGRTYTFKATSIHDRWVLSKMKQDGSYAVMQSVGKANRTSWTAAIPYTKSMGEVSSDSIMEHISRKKAAVTINIASIFDSVEF